MASGWKFSVTVPSWTQTTLEGDELVVFYRVEVKVLPPEKNGLPRTRSVLRRYNHFTKLHSKLVQELGQRAMLGKEAPAKRMLFNVNKRPELIERRRRELQQWLWRLISDPDVAKAKNLNDFLELSDAARLVQRVTAPSSSAEPPESVVEGSYGMSEGSSPRGDASSEISGFTAASMLTERAPSTRGLTPAADLALDRSIADGSRRAERQQTSASGALDSTLGEEGPNLRLGMRIEQRGNVKRLVRAMKQRLDAASLDLQEAVETMYAEREAKRQLAEKVAQLESRMSVDHTQREAELDRLLQQERQAAADLRTGLEEAAGNREDLRAELDDLRAAAAAAEAAPLNMASQLEPPAAASQGSLEAIAELEQRHVKETARLAQQLKEAGQRADAADTARSSASEQADAAKQETQAAQELLAATKTKSKADMKLLAKEVKSLRKQLSEALQRAESSETAAAAATAQAEQARAAAAAAEAEQMRAAAAAVEAEQMRAAAAAAEAEQLRAAAAAAEAEQMRAAAAAAEAEQMRSRAAISIPAPRAAAACSQQLDTAQPLQEVAVGPALPDRATFEAPEAPTDGSAETASDAQTATSQPGAEAASRVLQQHDQPAASGPTALQEPGRSPVEDAAVSRPGHGAAAVGHVTQAARPTASPQHAAERAAINPPQEGEGAAAAAAQSVEHNSLEGAFWRTGPQDSTAAVAGAESASEGREDRSRGASSLAEIIDERQLVSEAANLGPSDLVAEPSVPALSTTAASAPTLDSSVAEEAISRSAESPRPQQTATAATGQEPQNRGSSSLALLSSPISQEAGTGDPVDSRADKPSAGSLRQATEPAAEHTGDQPEAAAAGQPAAESLLVGHSRQSPAEDPFGASGSVSLFSGLDLAADSASGDSLAHQQPDSLAQQPTIGAVSGPKAVIVRAAEEQLGLVQQGEAGLVQRESLEGLDMQGLEDEMLEENSLAELGHVPGNNRLHSVISRHSSDLLSWDGESQASGGPDVVPVDSPSQLPRRPSSTAAIGGLRSVPENDPATAVAPPHPAVGLPQARDAPGNHDAQAFDLQPAKWPATTEAAISEAVKHLVPQVPESAWAPPPVAAPAAGVDLGARPSASGQPVGSTAAQPVQLGSGGGTGAASPQQAAAKRPAAAPTRAGPSAGPGNRGVGRQPGNQPPHPTANRAMGSFMTKMGFGGPAATSAGTTGGATAEQQPAAGVSAGLQGMFGGRDKLESFARGLMRKSAGKPEGPDT